MSGKGRGGAADAIRISHKREKAMSDRHAKATIMRNFELKGQGIEIKYQNNELTLSGEKLPAGGEKKFLDDRIARVKSDIGDQITVVLLTSSRNGTRFLLRLVVPMIHSPSRDAAISGAAIFVEDFNGRVGGPPNVLQAYDVVPLTGTMVAG
jgi:hypothetical protein